MNCVDGKAEPALVFRNLSVAYTSGSGAEPTVALDSFCAEVFPRRIFALVGESGSGKSTAGFAAGGLLPAQNTLIQGEISIKGTRIPANRSVDLLKKCGREIGFVFQEPSTALHPAIRIETQIAEALHGNFSRNDRKERVANLLRAVQLDPSPRILRAYPHHLSGGMQQRIVIAMAVANRPKVLVADEPTTALDPTVRKEILELIRNLALENDSAVLLITHDFGIVHHFADQVAVLYKGKVVETGLTAEVLNNPQHSYTKTLISSARGEITSSR